MRSRPTPHAIQLWQRLLRYERVATLALDSDLERDRGMSLEDYDVLFQLNDGGGTLRMSDLADAALIARSSCTRVVDRLVMRGWVERRANEQDRRSVVVALTPAGASVLRRAALTHVAGIGQVFGARLDERDLADLERILDRLG